MAVIYDPVTGVMLGSRGKPVTAKQGGYLVVWFEGKLRPVHRVAWYLHHGTWPEVVEHINRDKLDNRLCNLREADSYLNALNKTKYVNNRSGHKGVYRQNGGDKWRVQITVRGKVLTWNGIEDFELACLIADSAREKYHGEFHCN